MYRYEIYYKYNKYGTYCPWAIMWDVGMFGSIFDGILIVGEHYAHLMVLFEDIGQQLLNI